MAPPDGTVAVSFIRFGLLPLLPKELPPLPRKSDAFFVYHGSQRNPYSNLYNVVEGQVVSEDENLSPRVSVTSEHGDPSHMRIVSPRVSVTSEHGDPSLMRIDEDIPELIGLNNGSRVTQGFTPKTNNNIPVNESVQEEIEEGFVEVFQASLLEAVMSILLNTISILPDEAFRKLLEPNVIAHIFLAYCSHPNSTLKSLAINCCQHI